MWKLLIPLVFLACNSTTNSPETKKASFNLKEACSKGDFFTVPKPSSWEAYISYRTTTTPVVLTYSNNGLGLPCGFGVEGDDKATLTILYVP